MKSLLCVTSPLRSPLEQWEREWREKCAAERARVRVKTRDQQRGRKAEGGNIASVYACNNWNSFSAMKEKRRRRKYEMIDTGGFAFQRDPMMSVMVLTTMIRGCSNENHFKNEHPYPHRINNRTAPPSRRTKALQEK